jgi:hypothetical protein
VFVLVLHPLRCCRQQLSGILHFLQVHADQAGLSVIVTQAELNEALAPRKQDLPAIAAAVAATRAAKAYGSGVAGAWWACPEFIMFTDIHSDSRGSYDSYMCSAGLSCRQGVCAQHLVSLKVV